MNISDLRDALRREGRGFTMDASLPANIRARALRRAALSAAATTMSVLLVVSVAVVAALQLRHPADDDDGTQRIALPVTLADYYDDGHHEGDTPDAAPIPVDAVRDHVRCMREQGFALPDPRRTDRGWEVVVEEPIELRMDSRRWREAAFVTCRPEPPPGRGDLIFSLDVMSPEQVEKFRACMSAEGYELPKPTLSDRQVWRFDISAMGIDYGSDDWNRAVFVNCSPLDL